MPKVGLSGALSKRIEASQNEHDPIDRAYDEMFGLNHKGDGEKIVELDLTHVKPHPQDPFKPYSEEKLKELADSIAKVGLLDPINVRPDKNGGYEILTGKNRSNAARLNGDKKIKAIVRDVDDDTAVMIITDSNLKHREKLLPSEKAFAYKLQLDAVKKQGKRSDLEENETSTQIAWKSESACLVAEHNEVSRDEIRRYIRLTYLIPELLELVDNDEIPLMAGVYISQIDEQAQKEVYQYFFVLNNEGKLDLKTSAAIKEAFKDRKMSITVDTLAKLLNKEKSKIKPKPFSINRSKFKDFADKLPNDNDLEKLFLEFLHEKFGDK